MSLQAPIRRACETMRVTIENHSSGYMCKQEWQELLIVKRGSLSSVLDCLVRVLCGCSKEVAKSE